jgi:hypothetical protein
MKKMLTEIVESTMKKNYKNEEELDNNVKTM